MKKNTKICLLLLLLLLIFTTGVGPKNVKKTLKKILSSPLLIFLNFVLILCLLYHNCRYIEQFYVSSNITKYTNPDCQFDEYYTYKECHKNLLFEDMKLEYMKSENKNNINQFIYKYIIHYIGEYIEELEKTIRQSNNINNLLTESGSDDLDYRCKLPASLATNKTKLETISVNHNLPNNAGCKILWTGWEQGNQAVACQIGSSITNDNTTAFAIEQSILSIPILALLGNWTTLMKNLEDIKRELKNIGGIQLINNCELPLEVASGIWNYVSYSFARLDLEYTIIVIPYDKENPYNIDEVFKNKTLFNIEIPNLDDGKRFLLLHHDINRNKISKNFDNNIHMDYSNIKIEVNDFMSKDELLNLIKSNFNESWIKTFNLNESIINICTSERTRDEVLHSTAGPSPTPQETPETEPPKMEKRPLKDF